MTKVLDRNMECIKADLKGIRFLSPDDQNFKLDGFAWRKAGMDFNRLSGYDCNAEFSEAILNLAAFPAGATLRFCSDTNRVVIKAAFKRAHKIARMALTGTMGFDIYVREKGKMVFRGVTAFDFDVMSYCVDLFNEEEHNEKKIMREFIIHFPLYGEINSLEIGVEETAEFNKPWTWEDPRPIVCYGTSILHGACANRPGMAYPAIISRILERPVMNFGFAGSARGEKYMAKMLSAVDTPCCFILDYDPNSPWKNTQATAGNFIAVLREKHPGTPIIFVSKIPYPRDAMLCDSQIFSTAYKRLELEEELINSINDPDLYFISGLDLLDQNFYEASVDGCHISDYGFWQMAENISKKLKMIIKTK